MKIHVSQTNALFTCSNCDGENFKPIGLTHGHRPVYACSGCGEWYHEADKVTVEVRDLEMTHELTP